jgi:hypothetical protein
VTNPPDQPTPGDPLQQGGGATPPPQQQPAAPAAPTGPPPGYQATTPAPYASTPIPQAPGNPGLAVAGLVLGIISLLAPIICGVFSLPIGIAGIICSVLGRNQARERGVSTSMATAGLVCSIIGTVLAVLFAIVIGAIVISTNSS